jgi:hypothetical protein
MAKKPLGLEMLVIILALGMAVLGCDNGTTSGDDDTWINITDFSQVNGTWKTSDTITYTSNISDDIKVTENYVNYTMTFSSSAKTVIVSGTITQTYSGGNIDLIWASMIKGLFETTPDGITSSTNDMNHSIVITYNNYATTLTDVQIRSTLAGFQISENGMKLKQLGTSDGTNIDMGLIYTKQ